MTSETELRKRDARSDFLEHLETAGARVDRSAEPARIRGFEGLEREHRALTGTAGLLDETHRALVRVYGRKPAQMLDGLLTNDLDRVGPGRAAYSFMLTPKGRPVAELRILPGGGGETAGDEGTAYWLDLPAACVRGAMEHLGKFVPPLYARFERTAGRGRLAVVGPAAAEALAEASAGVGPVEMEPLELRRGRLAGGDVTVVAREAVEGPGFDLYLETGRLAAAWDAVAEAVREAGGRPAGEDAYDVWRVERGVPIYGADITTDNLPQETGQEGRAVSFDKGCYTGQEVVIRIHHRGHVNRLLRGLAFPGAGEPPPAGQELYRGDRVVGTVTSPARSPRFGAIALGYVRREAEPGERLALSPGADPAARIVELPFTEHVSSE